MYCQFASEARVKELVKEGAVMCNHPYYLDVVCFHKFLNGTCNGLVLRIDNVEAQ